MKKVIGFDERFEKEYAEFKQLYDARITALEQDGWKHDETGWTSPEGEKYTHTDAYDQFTLKKLKAEGWKAILEIKHIGKKGSKYFRTEDWGRFQSPVTNIIYSFLEAQHIWESKKENLFPDGCSKGTRLLNKIVGPNFTGDTIKTWFYFKNDEAVLELWTD